MSPAKKVTNKPSIIEETSEDHSESSDMRSDVRVSGQDRFVTQKQDVGRSAAESLAPDILNIVGKLGGF